MIDGDADRGISRIGRVGSLIGSVAGLATDSTPDSIFVSRAGAIVGAMLGSIVGDVEGMAISRMRECSLDVQRLYCQTNDGSKAIPTGRRTAAAATKEKRDDGNAVALWDKQTEARRND